MAVQQLGRPEGSGDTSPPAGSLIRDSTSPSPEIPSGVESEVGIRSYADSIVRNRAEDNGTGRGTKTINDDCLSGGSQFFVSFDIAPNLTAWVISNANQRMACSGTHKQETCRKHSR